MSYIAQPLPDPPPLRALRALQGRGIFGVAIQICVDNRDFEQALKRSPRTVHRLPLSPGVPGVGREAIFLPV